MSLPPRIAVVGGGIAGTLCSLVLKSRGLSPLILDAGQRGLGGRLRGGVQFLRSSSPEFTSVLTMLTSQGLLQEWKGRFGMLGTSGGGFLPASVISAGGMLAKSDSKQENKFRPNDQGDFCHFMGTSNQPTYVGMPTMSDLCSYIVQKSEIDGISDTRVIGATPLTEGGWQLQLSEASLENTFDALVLATHDASLGSRSVQSIIDAEILAGGPSDVTKRLEKLSSSLQHSHDYGRAPVFTIRLNYPMGFSASIPFDAVTIPNSQIVQFFSREASKPFTATEDAEIWTAVCTSNLASRLLAQPGLTDREILEQVSQIVAEELLRILQPYSTTRPLTVKAKRWGSAFCSVSLGLKEDCVTLAPWRLSIAGDFIRKLGDQPTPLEAAALSGLAAGEQIAGLFR